MCVIYVGTLRMECMLVFYVLQVCYVMYVRQVIYDDYLCMYARYAMHVCYVIYECYVLLSFVCMYVKYVCLLCYAHQYIHVSTVVRMFRLSFLYAYLCVDLYIMSVCM